MPSGKYKLLHFTPECIGAKVWDYYKGEQIPAYAMRCNCSHCLPTRLEQLRINQVKSSEFNRMNQQQVDHVRVERCVDGRLNAMFLTKAEKTMVVYELRKRRGWGPVRIAEWAGMSKRTVERHMAILKELGL